TNKTSEGYTVKCIIRDEAGISRVEMPTWTEKNGQDDITWPKISVVNKGNNLYEATYTVKTKDHKNETGKYNTHVYVYNKDNEVAVKTLEITVNDTATPKISNVKVENETRKGYTVTCDIQSDSKITKVEMPTWTEKNGQDDLIWHKAEVKDNGDGTYKATCEIKTSDHNGESGKYITHIYATNTGKTGVYVKDDIVIKNSKPVIKSATLLTKDSESYTLEIVAEDDSKVSKVYVPTWTEKNGQDDVIWHEAQFESGKWKCTINRKDHYYQYGNYVSHVYAYDNDNEISDGYVYGSTLISEPDDDLPHISDVYISDKNDDGYTITCKVTSKFNVTKVSFPTWTYTNGQDDLVWHQASYIGNNQYSFRILRSYHNYEFGTYITHIYAYDNVGNVSALVLDYNEIKNTTVRQGWAYMNGQKYFFDNNGNIAGNMPSKKVIDVSSYNGVIDWETVKRYGDVDGVIIRIASHPNGHYIDDPQFANNLAGCRRYNIPFGVYIYDYANENAGAYSEAQVVVDILRKYGVSPSELSYPVYFDLERPQLSTSQAVQNSQVFISRMNQYGYTAQLYSYRSMLQGVLNHPYILQNMSWMAAYTNTMGWTNPYYHGKFGWQYTSKGSIPGINGNVDISCWFNV
uniref:GBS Bsp-like repeat-containing protein n=2 Tax=Coprobacillaceae TaxID=2810280 RepID=UPI000FF111F9